MADNDKNKLGLFAVVFAAIFGTTYSIYKTITGSKTNKELERLRTIVDECFLEGKSEVEITNALIVDAQKKLGDRLTQDYADQLKTWVLEEKVKLRKQKKI